MNRALLRLFFDSLVVTVAAFAGPPFAQAVVAILFFRWLFVEVDADDSPN